MKTAAPSPDPVTVAIDALIDEGALSESLPPVGQALLDSDNWEW